MKRFAFLVLVFTATAFGQEGIKEWAENFETNIETVQMCLNEAETTEAEIQIAIAQVEKIEDENIDDETKKGLEKYNRFIACVLEKKEMMQDSKLIVDKIMETLDKEKDKFPINKEVVKDCLNGLNDDGDMTREDRALGMIICIYAGNEDKNKKK